MLPLGENWFHSRARTDKNDAQLGSDIAMRIEPKHAIVLGLLGTFILACLCASFQIGTIEQDLILRTKVALAPFKIQQLQVVADGRDVLLAGEAPTEPSLKQAIAAARMVDGVFRVGSLLRLPERDPVDKPFATPPAAPLP